MKPIVASLLLIAVAVSPGCKSKAKEPAKSGSGSAVVGSPQIDAAIDSGAVAVGSGSDSGSGSAGAMPEPLTGEDFESPTDKAIKAAFAGAPPKLPLLAKDGATAAVDLSESLGLSDMSTYEVGFVDGKSKVDRVTLIGAKAAETPDGDDLPVTDKLKAAATALGKRLADGGYTAFEKAIERQPEDDAPVALGSLGKLELKSPPQGDGDEVGSNPLVLTLVDAAGKQVAKETIKAIPASKKVGDCGGEPRLGNVYFDTARKRVLARIYYMTGGDTCNSIPGMYRLWSLP